MLPLALPVFLILALEASPFTGDAQAEVVRYHAEGVDCAAGRIIIVVDGK